MRESKWKRKARALARLAQDQRGKPEGESARAKLLEIINKHPEAQNFEPIQRLAMSDVAYMRRNNIDTDGVWTGGDFKEAIALMEQDYCNRIAAFRQRQRPLIGAGAHGMIQR